MTSNFKEDQAEQLRKHFEGFEKKNEIHEELDVLSLPPRKEKFKKNKIKVNKEKQKTIDQKERKRKRKVGFPLIKTLLLLFLLLILLVLTYPSWIERINLNFNQWFFYFFTI
ncbi:hypothetical protein BKP37_07695 [Anaerobacillus alkalilacustris]|uniref:Uncharacterized protein n=1 Tax=Anaerobacillus alkalilacustris TaxID=393763 RepID=A0A1S2LRL5_9BACI|nr:hypothetical protein [Anaerobacillus alkalilacustris]OIJ14850.1 hypothetical protein BKP37_07695 [Anaerobacillus alkalilacustris]